VPSRCHSTLSGGIPQAAGVPLVVMSIDVGARPLANLGNGAVSSVVLKGKRESGCGTMHILASDD
jgi:hypothetical protein